MSSAPLSGEDVDVDYSNREDLEEPSQHNQAITQPQYAGHRHKGSITGNKTKIKG